MYKSQKCIGYSISEPPYNSTLNAIPYIYRSNICFDELIEAHKQMFEKGYDSFKKDWENVFSKVKKSRAQIINERFTIMNESSISTICLKISNDNFYEIKFALNDVNMRFASEVIYKGNIPYLLRIMLLPTYNKEKLNIFDEIKNAEASVKTLQDYPTECPLQSLTHFINISRNKKDFLKMFYEILQNE